LLGGVFDGFGEPGVDAAGAGVEGRVRTVDCYALAGEAEEGCLLGVGAG